MNGSEEKPILEEKNKVQGILNGIFKYGLKKRSSKDTLGYKFSKISKISTMVLPRERPYSPSTDENSPICSKRFIVSALKLSDMKDLNVKEKAAKIIQNKWSQVAKKFRCERYVRKIISTIIKIQRNLLIINFADFKNYYDERLFQNRLRLEANKISSLKMLKLIYSKYSTLYKKNKFETWKIKCINFNKNKSKCLTLENTYLKLIKKLYFNKLKKRNSKLNFAPFIIKNTLQKKVCLLVQNFFIKLIEFNDKKHVKSKIVEKVIISLNRKSRIIKLSSSFEKWKLLSNNRIYKKISIINKKLNIFTQILKKNFLSCVFERLKEKRDKQKSLEKIKAIARCNLNKNLFSHFHKFIFKAKPRRLVLQKIVANQHELNTKSLLINLIKWKNKSKFLTLKTSARKIQNFFNYVKVKKSINNMKLNITKIDQGGNSLISAYKKFLLKFPFNKIKQEAKRRVMIKFLLFLRRKELRNFLYSIRRIQKFVKVKTIVLNAYAKRIQDKFRALRQKTKIKEFKKKIKVIKNILDSLIENSNKRILGSYLNIWRNERLNNGSDKKFVNSFKNSNTKIIQKFLRQKLGEKYKNLKINSQQNLKNIFKDYFVLKHFKPYMKNFLLEERFNRVKINLAKFYFIGFLKREYSYHYTKCFSNLNNVCSKIIVRKNKETFEKIKSYSEFIKVTRAANRINFYYNKFRINKRNKKITDIIFRLSIMNSQLVKFNFRKWLRNSNEIKLFSSANIITKYVHNKWTSLKCTKNWKKFISLYREKNSLIQVGRVLKNSKFCIFMEGITNLYKNKNLLHALEKLKLNSLNKLKLNFLTSIYNHYHCREEKLTKEFNFNLWKIITDKINKKEKSSTLINSLIKTSYQDYSKVTTLLLFKINVFRIIMKKLILKFSIKKINQRAENKITLLSFCNSLEKCEMLYDRNSKILARNKIMTLYIYKVLFNMQKILKNKVYQLHSIFFLNQLIINRVNKSHQVQNTLDSGQRQKQYKTLNFKQIIISRKTVYNHLRSAKVDKFLIAPFIFNFMIKNKNENLKSAFDKLKIIRRGSKLNEVITNLFRGDLPREKLLNSVKEISDYKLKTPILLNNLRTLLRKFFLVKILKPYLNESAKIVKLMYLLWITLRNKKRADSKFLSIIIRKWIFDFKMNILAKKKLSSMYQNIQNSFLYNSEVFYPGDEYDTVYNQLSTTKDQTKIFYKSLK
jgi:hypothetical protein